MAKVGQVSPFGLDPLHHFQGPIQIQVCPMRSQLYAVKDEHRKPVESIHGDGRYITAINDVGNGIDSVPHAHPGAMGEGKGGDLNPLDIHDFDRWIKEPQIEVRHAAPFNMPFIEDVGEFDRKFFGRPLVSIDRDGLFLGEIVGADIVDAMAVIGMGVGIENCVEPLDLFAQRLLAEVRAGVNEDALAVDLEPDRRSGAVIPGVF